MTKSQTFLDMSSKRDMMIFIYFSIFFYLKYPVRFIFYVSSVYFQSSPTCSTRNRMSSKSRSKRKPDQVGIDFCFVDV